VVVVTGAPKEYLMTGCEAAYLKLGRRCSKYVTLTGQSLGESSLLQGGFNKLLGHLGILLGLDLLVLGSLRPLQSWSVGGGIVVVAQLGTGCDRVIQMGDISQSQAQKLQQYNPHTGQLKVVIIIIEPLEIFTHT